LVRVFQVKGSLAAPGVAAGEGLLPAQEGQLHGAVVGKLIAGDELIFRTVFPFAGQQLLVEGRGGVAAAAARAAEQQQGQPADQQELGAHECLRGERRGLPRLLPGPKGSPAARRCLERSAFRDCKRVGRPMQETIPLRAPVAQKGLTVPRTGTKSRRAGRPACPWCETRNTTEHNSAAS